MAELRERRSSNSQLLLELDALSQTLYQSNVNRRTASLVLPRSAIPPVSAVPTAAAPNVPPVASDHRPTSRRKSMSPFRSRPKSHHGSVDNDEDGDRQSLIGSVSQNHFAAASNVADAREKKGIWGWKPIRALAHMRMKRISCLFSVEVVAIQGLPTSMNGLRLSVRVRKKESKEGAVQTMPARVMQGSADFEETLFIRSHVYCSGKPLKFEPHPFLISAVAIDAPELDFGKSSVDLSLMVKESMERNMEGSRINQWDSAFPLSGKAKGGELVVKLRFQIMEDGGVEIYKQSEATKSSPSSSSSSFARRQTKSSFSVSSPKITRLESPMIKTMGSEDLKEIDDFTLDEPTPPPPPPTRHPTPQNNVSVQKSEPEQKQDDLDLPEFEVIDQGIELQEEKKEEEEEVEPESTVHEASVSSEVVKEVVHDSAHLTRLTELDAIAQQIKALESMVAGEETTNPQESENQSLDADEETVTKEFLQMLELKDDGRESMQAERAIPIHIGSDKELASNDAKCLLSELGKGLGPIVQTRDGGYLASTNPFDSEVSRKQTPKLAMQISKPIILKDPGSGVELFQKLAAVGCDELASKLVSLAAMDELMGKTAEQIAFEGMASAIISGRNKEGASSSAAKSVAALKSMATYMTEGRKDRILTGIWNVKEEPVVLEEILPFSLQKIESMAIEALKIQAEMAEEAPFDVSPLIIGKEKSPLESPILPEDWANLDRSATTVTMLVVIQMRDSLRRYDKVGAPMIAFIQATKFEDDEEPKFKVTNLHVGGMKMRSTARRSVWDTEKQRLTAMQWLVAYGLGKAEKKKNKSSVKGKGGNDIVWSISSRVMADMWMKPMRNPDVKFSEKL